MLGIRFMKTAPTTYVLHYKNGQVVREGAGLSFWYFAPASTIVHIPLSSCEVPFAFEDVTVEFQVESVVFDYENPGFRHPGPPRLPPL